MSCKICTQIPITRLTLSAKLSILSWFLGGLYYIMFRDFIKQYGIEGILILGLLLSVMISVYVTIAVCLSIIIYMFASRKYNDVFREIPKVILWSAAFFCIAALVVSVARSNQTGVYIALGICIVVLTSMFLSRFMTQKLFETGISLCCQLSVLCLFMALLQLFASKDVRLPCSFNLHECELLCNGHRVYRGNVPLQDTQRTEKCAYTSLLPYYTGQHCRTVYQRQPDRICSHAVHIAVDVPAFQALFALLDLSGSHSRLCRLWAKTLGYYTPGL